MGVTWIDQHSKGRQARAHSTVPLGPEPLQCRALVAELIFGWTSSLVSARFHSCGGCGTQEEGSTAWTDTLRTGGWPDEQLRTETLRQPQKS